MMMAEPLPLVPNREAMLQALEHAFGGYLDGLHDGLLEITYVINQGAPDNKWIGALFGTDELEEAADYAAQMNAAGHNVYFAPALRRPGAARDKRASKPDVLGTTMLWAEWDDADAFAAAKEKLQFCKPTMGCITGMVPAKRAQAMWRLETAITDQAQIDAALRGMAAALGGDPKVAHADCLMRLPGSVSWRKVNKPERIDEMTAIAIGFADRPAIYPAEQVLQAYKPLPGGPSVAHPVALPEYQYSRGPLGLDGDKIEDGREAYMAKTVLAVMVEFIGQNGAAPTQQELFDAAWPQYSAHVDFRRPGRGPDEVLAKCASTLRRFHAGQISNCRDLDMAVKSYQAKQKRQQVAVAPQPTLPTTAEGLYRLLSIGDMRSLPPAEWLVDQYLPEGGFVTLYAPPKSLKSFLALDILLHIATGKTWRGKAVKQGAVLYIAGEGHRGAAKRIAAWLQHHGCGDDVPFFMTTHAIPMTEPGSTEKLIATVRAKADEIGMPITVVCVDTVARSFGSGDENATKDMNAFVAGCDAVRHAINCTVLGVHHTGKDKDRGMRGSTALLGAVDAVLKVERNESRLTLSVEEQRDGEEQEDIYFETQKVELAGHIKPTSSLVLVAAGEGEQQAAKAPRITQQQRLALEILIDAIARGGFVPAASEHIPGGISGVDFKTWKNNFRAKVASDAADAETAQKAFKRAADTLIAAGYVGKWQEFTWVISDRTNRTNRTS